MADSSRDQPYMARALELAVRGQGHVEPNPMVGCVIVRGGRVVGEGYHRRFGGPHAEIEALRAAGARARGALACVTLEPCCHFGKTPPCTDALIAAGVRRVVAAMRDPFPRVRGRGTRLLKKSGIEVAMGLLEAEAMRLNAPYLKLQREHRPWVILKWAQSLDGRIATRTGDSQWISGEPSRRSVHRLRSRVDAVVVGVGTVLADNPQLTCRHGRPRRVAARIVLDPCLRTPLDARLVRTARKIPTVIVADEGGAKGRRLRPFVERGVEIIGIRTSSEGLDLGALLDELGRRGMTNVLVEGGGRTLGAFHDAGLADEAIVFVAPMLIGGAAARSPLAGLGAERIRDALRPANVQIRRSGEDLMYQLRFT
jgi:diaminohydroxyphosphoribosylaminopyrimidine deaminase / 5-amino-6-(5-phosphoribosylamino)uracil reductase